MALFNLKTYIFAHCRKFYIFVSVSHGGSESIVASSWLDRHPPAEYIRMIVYLCKPMLCIILATALIYAPDMKIGILPENVLNALNSDRLVQSGSVMEFITAFFKVVAHLQAYHNFVVLLYLYLSERNAYIF